MTVTAKEDSLGRVTLGYYVGKAIPGSLSFLTIVVVLRLYGQDIYGQYALTLAAAQLSAAFATGWANQATLRRSGLEDHLAPLLATRGIVSAVGGLGVAVYIAVQIVAFRADVAIPVANVVAGVGLTVAIALQSLQKAALQSRVQVGLWTVSETVRVVGFAGLAIVAALVLEPASLPILIAAASGYLVATGVIAALASRRERAGAPAAEAGAPLRDLWAYGWPMSVWLAGSYSFAFADRYVLQIFSDVSAVGAYAGVYDATAKAASFVTLPLTLGVHALAMRSHNRENPDSARSLLVLTLKVQATASVLLLLAGGLLGSVLTERVLGLRVAQAGAVVALVLLGNLAMQVGLIAHKPLEMRNATRKLMAYMVLVAVVNVALNLWLVPSMNLLGAATATAVSGLLYIALTWWPTRHYWTGKQEHA